MENMYKLRMVNNKEYIIKSEFDDLTKAYAQVMSMPAIKTRSLNGTEAIITVDYIVSIEKI